MNIDNILYNIENVASKSIGSANCENMILDITSDTGIKSVLSDFAEQSYADITSLNLSVIEAMGANDAALQLRDAFGNPSWKEFTDFEQIDGKFYQNTDGKLVDYSGTGYSSKIKVQPGEIYQIYTQLGGSLAIVQFDVDGNKISATTGTKNLYTTYEIQILPNVDTIGISIWASKASKKIKVNKQIIVYDETKQKINTATNAVHDIEANIKVTDYVDEFEKHDDAFLEYSTGKIVTFTTNPVQYAIISAWADQTYFLSCAIGASLGIIYYNDIQALTSTTPEVFKISADNHNTLSDYIGTEYMEIVSNKYYVLKGLPIKLPENCKALGVCTYNRNRWPIEIKQTHKSYYPLENLIVHMDNIDYNVSLLSSSNPLYGKSYVATGDSWTNPNLTPHEDTYCEIIGKRNNMKYVNAGKSGTTMLSTADNSFINTYTNVLSDLSSADYITIAFGMNDDHSRFADRYGTKESNEISTHWGAYNVFLSSMLDVNPKCKIALIANEAVNQTYINFLSSVGAWWGIPMIDMRNDKNSTATIANRTDNSVNPYAITRRQSVFKKTSSSLAHPTIDGQIFRSSIIENFMCSI